MSKTQLKLLVGQRQKGETSKAVLACNDYLRMGAGRALRVLAKKYSAMNQSEPPTTSISTLTKWSTDLGWQKRAIEYDALIEEEKNRVKNEALNTGLALDYERVMKLKDLFSLLHDQLMEKDEETGLLHNLWLPDVKQVGSGQFAERVDIERYNSPLIGDIRGVLDDIAKEVGDRKLKTELTGKDGGALEVKHDNKTYDRAISSLAEALGKSIPGQDAEQQSTVDASERSTVGSVSDEG